MTVTLNLPEKIASHLLTIPESERNTDVIAGVQEGLADVHAGRTKPLEQCIAEQKIWWQARNRCFESMDSDGLAKIIARLEHIATRPSVFAGTKPCEAERFLHGFGAACWGLGYDPADSRGAAMTERGYDSESSLGPVPQMRARGMTDGEIVDELLAIEIVAWKRIAT